LELVYVDSRQIYRVNIIKVVEYLISLYDAVTSSQIYVYPPSLCKFIVVDPMKHIKYNCKLYRIIIFLANYCLVPRNKLYHDTGSLKLCLSSNFAKFAFVVHVSRIRKNISPD
jgi:hypothetical protein